MRASRCLVAVLLFASCDRGVDEKFPPDGDAASHEETDARAPDGLEAGASLPPDNGIDCIVPPPPGIDPASLVAPYSIEAERASLWMWTELKSAAGVRFATPFAIVSDVANTCASGPVLVKGSDGLPAQLVALTAEEQREAAARTDGATFMLEPTGGYASGDGLVVLFDRVLRGPGVFDRRLLGSGACVIEASGGPCVRGKEPLWTAGQRSPNRGGFVDADGVPYVFGCVHETDFVDPCSLTRVNPKQAKTLAGYTFWNASSGWVPDGAKASKLFDAPAALSGARNAFLGGYVAVVANIWDSTLDLRISKAPTGPYVLQGPIVRGHPPQGWFIGGGQLHAGLSRDQGRTLAFTYFTTSATAPGLHLVTVRLPDELRDRALR